MAADQSPGDEPAAPEGCRWVWVPAREIPAELRWEVVGPPVQPRHCRWTDHRVRCEAMSVVRMNRSTTSRPAWWHYCAEHMFGRRLVNGEVYTRIAEELPDA